MTPPGSHKNGGYCPSCESTNTERTVDGYRCKDCGFSETPHGWNDYYTL